MHTSIESLIGKGINDVNGIFSPSEEQQEMFREIWTDVVLSEIARGVSYGDAGTMDDPKPLYLYTSASLGDGKGSAPTENMRKALKYSGVSKSGRLPGNYCFTTEAIPMSKELQAQATELLKQQEQSLENEQGRSL